MPDPVSTHPELTGFPAVLTLPVQWGEMDAYGHVNNTVFFRYFESARIAYLDACGFLQAYERDRIGAILHSTDCRFRLPLIHPDTVQVGAKVVGIGNDRFTMAYRIVSLGADAVAADGTSVVVAYDYAANRKTALPAIVRQRIAALDGID